MNEVQSQLEAGEQFGLRMSQERSRHQIVDHFEKVSKMRKSTVKGVISIL
jgi:hypothetical protein